MFEESALEEVCERITDGSHFSPKSVETGFPMASVKDLNSFGVSIPSCRLISEDDFKKLIRQGCQPEKGDILISKDGATAIDTVCFLKTKPHFVLLSSVAIIRPDPKKISPKYLYFYLDCYTTKSYMKNTFTTGAAIPRVVLKDFRRIKIRFPNRASQEKIANIASSYYELLENNSRRIQLLESMAKLIYDEWFVKFKFPGHEKVKMVKSDLGDIPEGWEVKRVYDIVDIQKGLSYKSENLVDDGKIAFVNLKCFERGGGFRYDGVKRFEGDFKEKHIVKCGDIVLAVTDMTQNREIVARAARIPKLKENTIIISMDVVKMNPKNGLDKSWLFGLLNYSSFGITIKEFANGVNVLHLKSEPIGEYKFVMPDQKTIEVYSQIVSSMYQDIDNLQLKNQNLATTRDLLLPKLISGDLDVSELDIKVSEVGA
ncbi:MAG: restriction endonuclease subunit S [Candidatus Aenigmarchaeota archaeon]|nr:restriction endonuclease subunit S [Candidatus Aenigmarchaeota archaeon]